MDKTILCSDGIERTVEHLPPGDPKLDTMLVEARRAVKVSDWDTEELERVGQYVENPPVPRWRRFWRK